MSRSFKKINININIFIDLKINNNKFIKTIENKQFIQNLKIIDKTKDYEMLKTSNSINEIKQLKNWTWDKKLIDYYYDDNNKYIYINIDNYTKIYMSLIDENSFISIKSKNIFH